MASIGFGIIGSYFGPIGGLIGSAIGSYVDSILFAPATTPNLKNLSVTVSTYGDPIPMLFGPENRVSGNVIWSSGLKKKKYVGGKKKYTTTILTGGANLLGSKGSAIVTGGLTLVGSAMAQSNYIYSIDVAIGLADAAVRGPIKDITVVWANGTIIFDKRTTSGSNAGAGAKNTKWTAFRVYDGSFDQMPDPTIELAVGEGRTPAYRGTAYVVIENFQLADYGNRMPNFQFLVEADETVIVSAVVSKIAETAGIDPNTVSTSSIHGDVRGFGVLASSSATDALTPLALCYMFDVAEVAGGLRFWRRGTPPQAKIETDDLAAHQSTESRPEAITFNRAPETRLPQEATFSYIDPSMSWQFSSQSSRRIAGSSQSNLNTSAAIVLSADEAKQVADRMLWEAWTARSDATTAVSDRHVAVEPGLSYLFDTGTGFEPFRVKTVTRGANGVTQLEIAADRPEIYSSDAAGAAGNPIVQQEGDPPESFLHCLDIPMLRDADNDTGFYMVVDSVTGDSWRGATILRSTDEGENYDGVAVLSTRTTTGVTAGLAAGPTAIIDRWTVLTVTLTDPTAELDTITEERMLDGSNSAWVGGADGEEGEVLQFATATLIAPGIYELTDLLRGRLGTEYAARSHVDGETFVLLQGAMIARPDFSPSDWNKDRLYKAVTTMTLEDAWPAEHFTNTGESKRPLSPVHVLCATDDAGDTTITWVRRSRFRQPGLGGGPLALGEVYEAYEIDVLAGSAVVRTLTSTTPTASYDAAAKAADGVGPGDTVVVAVYQMSDVRGRGRPGYGEFAA